MEKNIKKHYIPPFVDLLSVDEDDLIMATGTGRIQGWDDSKKSIFFDDDGDIPNESTDDAGWENYNSSGE